MVKSKKSSEKKKKKLKELETKIEEMEEKLKNVNKKVIKLKKDIPKSENKIDKDLKKLIDSKLEKLVVEEFKVLKKMSTERILENYKRRLEMIMKDLFEEMVAKSKTFKTKTIPENECSVEKMDELYKKGWRLVFYGESYPGKGNNKIFYLIKIVYFLW